MINRRKGPASTWFSSLCLPPLTPHLLTALHWLLESSEAPAPVCRRGKGSNLPCRYRLAFHFSIMSPVADVHACCPCVYAERWTLFFYLSFSSFQFGPNREVRAKTLVHERTPHIVLFLCFVVSISMRWNPSCRIFCIARIVRQWEDGGAIWREFSYWMEPQQLPIGCRII